jgi:hypothetical protein
LCFSRLFAAISDLSAWPSPKEAMSQQSDIAQWQAATMIDASGQGASLQGKGKNHRSRSIPASEFPDIERWMLDVKR